MNYTIENDRIIVKFSTFGAELVSLCSKKDGLEYIWQGDPNYWNHHAPILFPVVGRLIQGKYYYRNKEYTMELHGFARNSEFSIEKVTNNKIIFVLNSDAKTAKIYPFSFRLRIIYRLDGDNLIESYCVENLATQFMYFSIGGHPAFNVPLLKNETFEDYFLQIKSEGVREKIPLIGAFVDSSDLKRKRISNYFNLQHDLFANDALIVQTEGVTNFLLKSKKSQRGIKLSYSHIPYAGIWSTYPNISPFLCIEPWCGIADDIHATGELEKKMGINKLAARDTFKMCFTITIF